LIVEEAEPDEPLSSIANVANWALWLVFAAYLIAMLATVENRWRWLRRNPVGAAIFVLTPPFIQSASSRFASFGSSGWCACSP
jgi:hypothetical protein